MGSLFQLRDYWQNTFSGEEFSASALSVGDIDNNGEKNLIAVGSFQGVLRVIDPGTTRGDMQASHVLLEHDFGQPILQIECGPFEPVIDGVTQNLLAVLFPRQFMYVRILRHDSGSAGGASSHSGSRADTGEGKGIDFYYDCIPYFQTELDHTTYNFVSGPFGKIGYHMVCVQSMDGLWTVIDHNKVLYRRFLPSNQFLLPGCLAYSAQKDCFLTNNSSMFLMCYTFSNYTTSAASETRNGTGPGVKIAPKWAFNLGDDAVAIRVCRLSRGLTQADGDIVVLCPYTLYVLSLSGESRLVKRLDVETICLTSYPVPGIGADNLLIGTLQGTVNVYSDVSLEWSAKAASGTPLSLAVGALCGVEGMIVTLNSESNLAINYLGTDPAEGPVQTLESKASSYNDMSADLKRVQYAIRQLAADAEAVSAALTTVKGDKANQDTQVPSSPSAAVELPPAPAAAVSATVPAISTTVSGLAASTSAVAEDKAAAAVAVSSAASDGEPELVVLKFEKIGLTPLGDNTIVVPLCISLADHVSLTSVTDVVIHVGCAAPLVLAPAQFHLDEIRKGDKVTIPFKASAEADKDMIIPSSLEVVAVAQYTAVRMGLATAVATTSLPLSMVARPVAPIKNTAFAIQLNTSQSSPPSLLDLFPEMVSYGHIAPNVLSVHYLNGASATILVSKNAARFKVQGSTMEGLWLLSDELLRRARTFYQQPNLAVTVPDEPPVLEFCGVIDTHTAVRRELADAVAALDKNATLFRAVQKRLLARFRDRNPGECEATTELFKESYQLLQKSAAAVQVAKGRLRQASAMLNCCARVVHLWISLAYAPTLRPQDSQLIKGLFSCDIADSSGVSWEEVTEAALVSLLDSGSTRKTGGKVLTVNLNTHNLKKHVKLFVEHIKAGKPLNVGGRAGADT